MSDRKLKVLFMPCVMPLAGEHPLFDHVALYQIRAYLNQFEEIRRTVEIGDLPWEPRIAECGPGEPLWSISNLCRQIVSFGPDVVAFSLYLWSIEPCVRLTSYLKRMFPEIRFLAGGSEVAEREQFVRDFPIFDIAIDGEGELPAKAVIERLASGNPDLTGIPNVSFRSSDGTFVHGPFSARTEDPARMPIFWTEGPFAKDADGRVAYFTGTRGCNKHCSYCLYSKQRFAEKTTDQALAEISAIAARPDVDVIFVNDYDLYEIWKKEPETFSRVARNMREGRNPRISFCASPYTLASPDFMDVVGSLRIDCIYLGVQTTNPDSLTAVHRKWAIKHLDRLGTVPEAVRRFVRIQLLVPLPYETPETFFGGLQRLFDLGYYRLQLFPLAILRGTELRRQAGELGLKYFERPPYHCFETPTFPARDWVDACSVGRILFEVDEAAFKDPNNWSEGWKRLTDLFRRHCVQEIVDRVRNREPVEQIIGDLLAEAGLTSGPSDVGSGDSSSAPVVAVPARGLENPSIDRKIFPRESVLKAMVERNGLTWAGETFDGWRLSMKVVEEGLEAHVLLVPATDPSPCYSVARHLKVSYSGPLQKIDLLDELVDRIEKDLEVAE